MDRALLWFIRVWVAIAIAVNMLAVAGLLIRARGFGDGWHRVTDVYSPFNLINYLMELVLISPALGAYLWLERRRRRVAVMTGPMSAQEAQQIVNAYGVAMAKPLRELRKLPYPKEQIKQALLIAIRLTPPGTAREQLRSGYVTLADWQDSSVGDPMTAMVAEGKALLAELRALGL